MAAEGLGSIALRELVVERGGRAVIEGLSVDFEQGCWHAVLGANGSGKTTLLRAMAGRLETRAGQILIDGLDYAGRRESLAEMTGFAVGGELLPGVLSPDELFSAIAWQRGQGPDGIDPAPLLHALALEPHLRRPIGMLSAGVRQRIALYCAFVGSPAIAILDEPFNWLDPLVSYDVKSALRALTDHGLTLVTAVHESPTIIQHCDRLLLMDQGRFVLDMSGDGLRSAAKEPARLEALVVRQLRGFG